MYKDGHGAGTLTVGADQFDVIDGLNGGATGGPITGDVQAIRLAAGSEGTLSLADGQRVPAIKDHYPGRRLAEFTVTSRSIAHPALCRLGYSMELKLGLFADRP